MLKGLSFLPTAAFTLMRPPYYAAFYGCVIYSFTVIGLYKNPQYVPFAVDFRALLTNDIHGFIRLKKKPLEDVFRGFLHFYFLIFGLNIKAAKKPKTTAAHIPAAAALTLPVNMPTAPSLSIASKTP